MTLVIYNERHIAPPRQTAAVSCKHAALTLQEHSLLWNNCYPKEPSGSHCDKLVAKYCSWQQAFSSSGCYTKYNKQITLWLPPSVADETPNIKENHLCWRRRLNKLKHTLQVKRVLKCAVCQDQVLAHFPCTAFMEVSRMRATFLHHWLSEDWGRRESCADSTFLIKAVALCCSCLSHSRGWQTIVSEPTVSSVLLGKSWACHNPGSVSWKPPWHQTLHPTEVQSCSANSSSSGVCFENLQGEMLLLCKGKGPLILHWWLII